MEETFPSIAISPPIKTLHITNKCQQSNIVIHMHFSKTFYYYFCKLYIHQLIYVIWIICCYVYTKTVVYQIFCWYDIIFTLSKLFIIFFICIVYYLYIYNIVHILYLKTQFQLEISSIRILYCCIKFCKNYNNMCKIITTLRYISLVHLSSHYMLLIKNSVVPTHNNNL